VNAGSSAQSTYHEFIKNETGHYLTELYDQKVSQFLVDHKRHYPGTPFFLFHSMYAIHGPLEAPTEAGTSDGRYSSGLRNYFDDCRHISLQERRIICAMNAAIDDSLRNLDTVIAREFPGEPSVLIMTGDNGGSTWWQASNNQPLRGNKGEAWEGGTRNHVLVWGSHPDLQTTSTRRYNAGFMHLVDWHETMVELARLGTSTMPVSGASTVGYSDGKSVWKSITQNAPPSRDFMIWAEDEGGNNRGWVWRKGDYKLLMNIRVGANDARLYGYSWPKNTWRDNVNPQKSLFLGGRNGALQFYDRFLFNIRQDPGETTDLAGSHRSVADQMEREWQAFKDGARESTSTDDFECTTNCWSRPYADLYEQAGRRAFPQGGNPCGTAAQYPIYGDYPLEA
jgi:arylsulfatase A-like enzyme